MGKDGVGGRKENGHEMVETLCASDLCSFDVRYATVFCGCVRGDLRGAICESRALSKPSNVFSSSVSM